jgi:hypothetical protein
VHAPTPRHRRKAGSGPPAHALIAWIATDPYLRDAATTASHRREIALLPVLNTRSGKAAVAACSLLACAAVMGITEIASHGRAAAQQTMAVDPGRGTARGASQVPFVHAGNKPLPMPSAAPAATAPAFAERPASQPSSPLATMLPMSGSVDVHSSPAPSVSLHRTGNPHDRATPTDAANSSGASALAASKRKTVGTPMETGEFHDSARPDHSEQPDKTGAFGQADNGLRSEPAVPTARTAYDDAGAPVEAGATRVRSGGSAIQSTRQPTPSGGRSAGGLRSNPAHVLSSAVLDTTSGRRSDDLPHRKR